MKIVIFCALSFVAGFAAATYYYLNRYSRKEFGMSAHKYVNAIMHGRTDEELKAKHDEIFGKWRIS